MAIEFVVEDGTGKSDATSYCDVTSFRQYWTNRGITFTEVDDAIKPWLNLSTNYIDFNYRFVGARANEGVQSLQWPRTNVLDRDGNEILNTVVPDDIINACIELARVVKSNSDLYNNDSDIISSHSIGPVSVSYKNGVRFSPYKSTLIYLKPYLMGGTLLVNRV